MNVCQKPRRLASSIPDAEERVTKRNADAEILLTAMRAAILRLRLVGADIEEVAAALRAGQITPLGAIYWLRENGVADLVMPSPPPSWSSAGCSTTACAA
jgi:hypothetical protein